MRHIVAQIPHGFQVGCSWINKATIRELTGYDEQLIAASQTFFPPFKTSMLLERVIEFHNVPTKLDLLETIRNLPVGDRIALILQLRKITFGTTLHCKIQCPNCTDKLSVDLPIDSILQPTNPNPQTVYHINLEEYTLKVRPINGSDLEIITQISKNTSTDNLSEKLLRACIISSEPPLPETLSKHFQEQLGTSLSHIDRQADLTLNINCPSCNMVFQSSLDVEDFFFQEVTSRYNQLEREIHWIALHYNWSEKDILSLPSSKRKRYVDLINLSLSGQSV
ncbi:MAG: hypothetical protein FWC14_02740 [Candidatus Bathyarchaeota archaeon]|uniref:T4 family baseplate hub assembly chaperone n=1 Tax=Candidatus Bathycorpusculum sp. TaxID=2994959 RepID=UPI002822C6F0|nr:hypothetical protein [Candidatus Termiticorpusculum sp.]MCL2292738.1 hypothetical protein [Candidatus Termiticorpusculum sp.]